MRRPAAQLMRSPYFRQIAHTSPLRMREDLSARGTEQSEADTETQHPCTHNNNNKT